VQPCGAQQRLRAERRVVHPPPTRPDPGRVGRPPAHEAHPPLRDAELERHRSGDQGAVGQVVPVEVRAAALRAREGGRGRALLQLPPLSEKRTPGADGKTGGRQDTHAATRSLRRASPPRGGRPFAAVAGPPTAQHGPQLRAPISPPCTCGGQHARVAVSTHPDARGSSALACAWCQGWGGTFRAGGAPPG
jgi:hypothetical protein